MVPSQLDQRIVSLSRDLVSRLDRQRRLCAAFRAGVQQRLTALQLAAIGVRDALLDALERDPRRPDSHAAMLAADLRLEVLAADAAELEPIACEEIARTVRDLREAIGACAAVGVRSGG